MKLWTDSTEFVSIVCVFWRRISELSFSGEEHYAEVSDSVSQPDPPSPGQSHLLGCSSGSCGRPPLQLWQNKSNLQRPQTLEPGLYHPEGGSRAEGHSRSTKGTERFYQRTVTWNSCLRENRARRSSGPWELYNLSETKKRKRKSPHTSPQEGRLLLWAKRKIPSQRPKWNFISVQVIS